jgi:hypothetical protein
MKDYEKMTDEWKGLLGADPQQRVRDLTAVMGTESGRRIVAWLIYDVCGLEHIIFQKKVLDVRDGVAEAIHGAVNDGKRAVGRQLKIILNVVPALLRKAMTDEAYAEAERLEAINTPWATDNPEDRA